MALARYITPKPVAKLTGGGLNRASVPTVRTTAPVPAPQAPPPAAMGVDPSYLASTGAAQRQLGLSMAGLDYQQGQLGGSFGIGVNAQGTVFDDPSNPYSRAAVLQESYRRAQAGNTNSMAARGQLYSGALQNAQNEAGRQHAMGRDQLVRQFMAQQQAITQGKLGASNAYQDAIAQAEAERIKYALQMRGGLP